jgi:putative SOS response-associated peptidase YedK
VMTDSEDTDAAGVHDRTPVLLAPEDQARWLTAPPAEALDLCRGWAGPLEIARTCVPWAKSAAPVPARQPGLF